MQTIPVTELTGISNPRGNDMISGLDITEAAHGAAVLAGLEPTLTR